MDLYVYAIMGFWLAVTGETKKHTDTDGCYAFFNEEGKKIWTEVCKQNWEEYNLCKHCGKAQMVTVEIFARTRAPPNRFEAKLQESVF